MHSVIWQFADLYNRTACSLTLVLPPSKFTLLRISTTSTCSSLVAPPSVVVSFATLVPDTINTNMNNFSEQEERRLRGPSDRRRGAQRAVGQYKFRTCFDCTALLGERGLWPCFSYKSLTFARLLNIHREGIQCSFTTVDDRFHIE